MRSFGHRPGDFSRSGGEECGKARAPLLDGGHTVGWRAVLGCERAALRSSGGLVVDDKPRDSGVVSPMEPGRWSGSIGRRMRLYSL